MGRVGRDGKASTCFLSRQEDFYLRRMGTPIRKFYCCNRSYNNKGDLRRPLNPPGPMSNLSERSAKTPVSIRTVGMIIHNRKKDIIIITSITTQAS